MIRFRTPVDVVYVVTNKGEFPATDVRLVPKLPALLPVLSAEPANLCTVKPPGCVIGDLAPGASTEITFRLSPDLPKDTQVSGTVTAADDSNADNNTDSTAFTLIPPDLTLAVAVDKSPAYVGGPPVAVTYTVSNDGRFPARDVKLAASLPSRLPVDSTEPAGACRALVPAPGPTRPPATGSSAAALPEPLTDNICSLGGLDPGQKATVTFRLRPDAPLDAVLTGEVTGNVEDATPADNRASQALKVLLPTIAFDPPQGPPGFVTTVRGANFPKGAHIRLSWDFGIMSVTRDVVVADDGTFAVPLLVFPRETPGGRVLTATGVSGPQFRPATAPFTVVPGTEQPRDFVNRR